MRPTKTSWAPRLRAGLALLALAAIAAGTPSAPCPRGLRYVTQAGKKLVYLAHDATLDRDVAFALIKTEGL
ncbi:MAG TPA: hypothetical protein EYP62_05660, partial [Kiritimatiellae bacterium]|nr:hypothetical protein [Kiritimatiellia bacterium]